MSNPLGTRWPLAPAVIDYIALPLRRRAGEACVELQGRLPDRGERLKEIVDGTESGNVVQIATARA